MVTIIIGKAENQKTFVMHKSFASFYSPFFHKAFDGPWIEGKTQTCIIPEFDYPRVFGGIMSWMYTQSLSDWERNIPEMNEFESYTSYLFIAWVLADFLVMPKLQNQIVIAIWDSPRVPIISLARWLSEHTTTEGRLHDCFIMRSVRVDRDHPDEVARRLADLPRKFRGNWYRTSLQYLAVLQNLNLVLTSAQNHPELESCFAPENFFVKED